jgi:hypothetical protein
MWPIEICLVTTGCVKRSDSTSLNGLNRAETLWRNPNGSAIVALYERPLALSKNQEFIVCETGGKKAVVASVPRDAFAWVDRDTLVFYDTARRTMPGWYKLTRNHKLNWWQRTFGDEPLGGYEQAQKPSTFEMPNADAVVGGVFVFREGKLSRVADEERLQELWDAPAEGLVYVASPGIAVRYASQLPSVCREEVGSR